MFYENDKDPKKNQNSKTKTNRTIEIHIGNTGTEAVKPWCRAVVRSLGVLEGGQINDKTVSTPS